jgi:predicted DNA-binding protein (UPF0251 family)
MARPKNLRKIHKPPHFRGFNVIRSQDNNSPLQNIIIHLEEYESIKLCDFDLLSQEEASKVMGVSRPTFTRIYSHARRKVAEAFTLGKNIVFEGGKVIVNSEWYVCSKCKSIFSQNREGFTVKCLLCGNSKINIADNNIIEK